MSSLLDALPITTPMKTKTTPANNKKTLFFIKLPQLNITYFKLSKTIITYFKL